jgi:glycosyltransferase involved in cell wall biosynthesis
MIRVAAVLWNGQIGGAETYTADLCRTMRDLGAEPGIVFVTGGEPLSMRLDANGIPYRSLELRRGREVAYHPRALARAVQALGPDGVVLTGGGYLAAALRIGGYRGRIVAVMHGGPRELGPSTLHDRVMRPINRATGFWATDVDVAVSDFVLSQMQRQRRRGLLTRIYNGVDLDAYTGRPSSTNGEGVTVAYGGRLIEGKGVDVLLRAFAAGAARDDVRLRIGGDGPARPVLERLAAELGLTRIVEFTGWIVDMPSFWRACDVGAMPSDRFIESFGMSAVEAMACGRPIVVTDNGGLPELVVDGITGFVVPRGDASALADALAALTSDADKRREVGNAARARCEQRFNIRVSAAAYLRLFREAGDGHGD